MATQQVGDLFTADANNRQLHPDTAMLNKFKSPSDGPFHLIELEVMQPLKSNIGFVGKQVETAGGLLRGGGAQIQFDEKVLGKDRINFLKPVSQPLLLKQGMF